ncbi:MAG: hypothetical protein BGO40_12180 [Chryseobacterium sp. 39-10]|nr:T9SS type A sorting domain-containing protein [Chryseobacterium sp.]OJV46730.1 MAG: hypothetical protein BGO40_12180 [Chryseobacterium sp. 39-10]
MKKIILVFLFLPLFFTAQVKFKSPEFELGIRKHLNLSETDEITFISMDTIRKIDLSGLGITDVNDVIYLKKVRNMDLSNNGISNVSPLLYLPHLQVLNISNNNLKNIATFSFSNKRNFKLIASGNEITRFDYLSPATFSNVEAIGTNRQKEPGPDFLLNDLFTTTKSNGQAKIYYNIWDKLEECAPFSMNYGDGNSNASLQCGTFTNTLDYDYSVAGFKEITIEREDKLLKTHFVAPYSFLLSTGQTNVLDLNLPSEIEILSLENSTTLGLASIIENQIHYQALEKGSDVIKVKYKYSESNRIETFYISVTNDSKLATIDSKIENSVNVYPNPFTDNLKIKCKNQNIQDILLYDLNGELIKDIKSINKKEFEFKPINLPSSMYLLMVITNKGIQTFKIIKK